MELFELEDILDACWKYDTVVDTWIKSALTKAWINTTSGIGVTYLAGCSIVVQVCANRKCANKLHQVEFDTPEQLINWLSQRERQMCHVCGAEWNSVEEAERDWHFNAATGITNLKRLAIMSCQLSA